MMVRPNEEYRIDTQDAIFGQKNAKRVVEIGPTDTLRTMAQRTLTAKYEARDAARLTQRRLLALSKDEKEIFYEYDPIPEPPSEPPAHVGASSTSQHTMSPVVLSAANAPVKPSPKVVQTEDVPVMAVDVVRALVAHTLKRPLSAISMTESIKDLVKGKSVLQNEIVGDLDNEFGNLPDNADSLPLVELGSLLQTTYSGDLGKQTSLLIAKMISMKMPAGSSAGWAKKYLESRWGLGTQRQKSVMVIAVTMQPGSRLPSDTEAKEFFDEVVRTYAVLAGIDLSSTTTEGEDATSGPALDPAALNALTEHQRKLHMRHHELLGDHLGLDSKINDEALSEMRDTISNTEAKLDLWITEHGDVYGKGILPKFSRKKVRVYDSCWNWVHDDVMRLHYELLSGKIDMTDRQVRAREDRIINRATPKTLDLLQYLIKKSASQNDRSHKAAAESERQLLGRCKNAINSKPLFKDPYTPTAPKTIVDAKGVIEYTENPRPETSSFEEYSQAMIRSDALFRKHSIPVQGHNHVNTLHRSEVKHELFPTRLKMLPDMANQITPPKKDFEDPSNTNKRLALVPFLHLKERAGSTWSYSERLSGVYLNALEGAARSGVTFHGKTALVIGTGAGSIGAMILQGLVSGGASVITTTSNFTPEVTQYYQSIYASHGARGSGLILVPFNQGSKQDVEELVDYVYSENGINWDLDYVLPFAAISEAGNEIDNIDSKSELAHRLMLTNVLRLLGSIKKRKLLHGYNTRPTQIILPLSPNHGTFGSDGLYSESKIALETLFNKWRSEDWSEYLTICGANIGWTRGTGLMSGNNIVAKELENLGIRTFSPNEMAFNILGLMVPSVAQLCEVEPVYADLTGSIGSITDLKAVTARIRQDIMDKSEDRRDQHLETSRETNRIQWSDTSSVHDQFQIRPRANLTFQFPQLLDYHSDIAPLNDLKGMVDLDRVVVVTGFSELGPWGNTRTRWEMEAFGKFSLEGCIEMAWIMGLIKHHNGPIKTMQGAYTGWVDVKSGEPIHDGDVKSKYERHILDHTGIRLVETDMIGPRRENRLMHEVVIQENLPPFEASKDTANDLKKQHGDKAHITHIPGTEEYLVHLKAGAMIRVPKAANNEHFVAAQIPQGWDARKYGIPEDIINQVDKAALYTLICTTEALVSAGITDPYELYHHVHIAEVGNCIGSGFGGADSLRDMYKGRMLEKTVQNDVMSEAFINTISAWVNMLLMSSAGPNRTPVGACATAVESLDIGYDTIVSGKARVCLVGACDVYGEDTAQEFKNMKAVVSEKAESARARTPKEMSRPTTTTRDGFVEAEGAGVQLITSARVALEMGLPIWGIVALTATASDKIGRSVPAPGQGILSLSREVPTKYPSPLLNLKYRRRQLQYQLDDIERRRGAAIQLAKEETFILNEDQDLDALISSQVGQIDRTAQRQRDEALNTWGNEFWKRDPTIAPLRGALATWGLTIEDLNVASLHGTSTQANDSNEGEVICKQLRHLGRSKGNVILAICQKYLTGHPKGPAGAWMFNGALQVLDTGLVPGNRNADNVDKKLEPLDLIHYPGRAAIQTDGIKAVSLTSFGFGQKSAQAVVVHPRYLFATLEESDYEAYKVKASARQERAYRYGHRAMANENLFVAKEKPPYEASLESEVYLSPSARAEYDEDRGSFGFHAAGSLQGGLRSANLAAATAAVA